VPLDGGTFRFEDPAGTTYTLQIPDGALINEFTLSLIPVTEMQDLPLTGGLGAAVHLEPEGLRLLKPATLTIEPVGTLDVESTIPFGYSGDAQEFYLVPPASLADGVTLLVTHFSGYGYGSGNTLDRQSQMDHPPSSSEDCFAQAAADALKDSYTLEGDLVHDSDAIDALANSLEKWWTETVHPKLMKAISSKSLDSFEAAVNEYTRWQNAIQLTEDVLGISPDQGWFSDELSDGWAIIESAFENLRATAISRCVEQHDFRAINMLLQLERIADNLNLPSITFTDIFTSCLHFQLEFDGEVEINNNDTYISSMRVNTTIDLEWISDPAFPAGIAALGENENVLPESQTFTWTAFDPAELDAAGCHFSEPDISEGYWAAILLPDWQSIEDTGSFSDIELAFHVAGPTAYWSNTCQLPYEGFNDFIFHQLVSPGELELFLGNQAPVHRGWTILGGETYATKSVTGEATSEGITVKTDFKLVLKHLP
jgi:hypothetical protein